MKLITIVIVTILILVGTSCSTRKNYDFDETYLVINNVLFNDSIVDSKNEEYLISVQIKDDHFRWTKQFFRFDIYQDLEIEEETLIDCNIDKNGVVLSFNNWDEFYQPIEQFVDSFFKANPKQESLQLDKLRYMMSDSLIIQNI